MLLVDMSAKSYVTVLCMYPEATGKSNFPHARYFIEILYSEAFDVW